jgi:hypothetical protein
VIAAKVDLYRTDLIGLDEGYELVTMFDCLHDMGDPIGAVVTSAPRSGPTAHG